MRKLIFFLFLMSASAYAQDCKYTLNKNSMLETTQEILAFNKDLSGIMVTAKRVDEFKYFELFMFLSHKAAFDKGNTIQLTLENGFVLTGIFSEYGKAIYSETVGYHALQIRVNFPQDDYELLTNFRVINIKMRANSMDIEMQAVGNLEKFMQIVKCIL